MCVLHPVVRTGTAAWVELTSAEVSKHVVTLFGEGNLVDSVSDEAGFQQVPSIFASFTAVGETFQITVEPVHDVRACQTKNRGVSEVPRRLLLDKHIEIVLTNEGIGDGDL